MKITNMILFICVLAVNLMAAVQTVTVQDDTVKAPNVTPPVIDANGNDLCWSAVEWQSIDQVWITYGQSVDPVDYTGRYKVVWSSETNLLYFLVEVTDDVAVGGFRRGQTADNYNYDLIEVFIDENRSGGLHVFDGTVAQQLGTNAENAFSYHIYADFPAEGQVNNVTDVGDLDGTGWNNSQSVDYSDHLPEFALKKQGNLYTREFSLIVYNDTFEVNRKDQSRPVLTSGKVMGLSLAVCDNDGLDEEPKTRDNFYGSVWVPAAAYNDHWMNADGYGVIKLVDGNNTKVGSSQNTVPSSFKVYSGSNSRDLKLNLTNNLIGNVQVKVYNILGQQVFQRGMFKSQETMLGNLSLPNLSNGVYFVMATLNKSQFVQKIFIAG